MDFSNWKNAKQEIRKKLKECEKLLYHCDLIELRDALQYLHHELDEVIELADSQH